MAKGGSARELAPMDVASLEKVEAREQADALREEVREIAERIPEKGRKIKPAFRMPEKCPSCGHEVEEEGHHSICRNHFGCRAQREGRLRHFVSQEGLDIANLGDETVAELVERGLVDSLAGVPGIGRKTAKTIHGFLHLEYTEKAIDDLLREGVRVQAVRKEEEQPLGGKNFAFTGSLSRFSRSEAKKVVESLGGKVLSSVSGETDYVVIGEDPGQKAEAAQKRDVRRIDEQGFVKLLRDAGYQPD